MSPQVVEAVVEKVVGSASPMYEVVFKVTKVYKKYRGPGRLKKRRSVSLPFRKGSLSGGPTECVATADLRVRRKYFLFVSGASSRKEPLKNVYPPLPSSKRIKKRIRRIICQGCAKAPTVNRLRDDSVVRGHSANLTCQFDGTPPPNVTWLKDGIPINPARSRHIRVHTRRIRIRHRARVPRRRKRRMRKRSPRTADGETLRVNHRRKTKRRKSSRKRKGSRTVRVISTLSLRRATDPDAGIYSCVGKSVLGEASAKASLSVVPPLDPGIVYPCPYDSYCLNGGTCMFFKHFGEFVCQCAEGYKGQRCQEKEVFPTLRDYNCRGSLSYMSSTRGLRCPRNQPRFLWEYLQQSLAANKRKVSSWTEAQHLSWSPGRAPVGLIWPRAPVTTQSHRNTNQDLSNFSQQNSLLQKTELPRKELLSPRRVDLAVVGPPSKGFNVSNGLEHGEGARMPNFVHPGEILFPSFPPVESTWNNTHNNSYPHLASVLPSQKSVQTYYVPKNFSGQNENFVSSSMLKIDPKLLKPRTKFRLPPTASSVFRRRPLDGTLQSRVKYQNKPSKHWPLKEAPAHSRSLSRQRYIYPTSLTPTPNDPLKDTL